MNNKQYSKSSVNTCFICNSSFEPKSSFTYRCTECKFYFSNLKPGFGQDVEGISYLRKKNFDKIVHEIIKIKSSPKILEIGSGDGFFIDKCLKLNLNIVGSEASEKNIIKLKKKFKIKILKIILPFIKKKDDEKFDVIVFNDVFEHLTNINDVISQIKNKLNKSGIILINFPSSDGFIFKLSEIFMKFGFLQFYDRMWQRNMSSPHLSYFNKNNIIRLFKRHNFNLKRSGYLDTVEFDSSKRIGDSFKNKIVIFIISKLLTIFYFIQKLLPRDICYVIFEEVKS